VGNREFKDSKFSMNTALGSNPGRLQWLRIKDLTLGDASSKSKKVVVFDDGVSGCDIY
jgi:hypothetical protein